MLRISAFITVVAVSLASLAGCDGYSRAAGKSEINVGADRDAHGCIPSAGYSWCAKEGACLRSWELAKEKGFANSQEAYEKYCSAK